MLHKFARRFTCINHITMTKYKCIIADDNILERDLIEMHLAKMPQLEILGAYEDGFEAQKFLANAEVDIVFSDIDMPNLNGFGLLKALKNPPVFIFISSHSEYAVESYNLDVIDFIIKPVTFERVFKAVNKAIEYIELKDTVVAKPGTTTFENENYFFIRESNDLVKLAFEDVAYIESMGDFSKIFTLDDKRHITLVSLKNLEAQLSPDYFTRVHKQYIINHHHISAISTDEMTIAHKYTVQLSPSYRPILLDKVVNKKIVTRHISK